MLYVHGTVLGVQVFEKQGKKPLTVIHVLDGFEKDTVLSNKPVDFVEGENVEIPVKLFNEKYYAVNQ